MSSGSGRSCQRVGGKLVPKFSLPSQVMGGPGRDCFELGFSEQLAIEHGRPAPGIERGNVL